MDWTQLRVLGDVARAAAARYGGKLAFAGAGRPVTFAEANERMNRLSNALTAAGLAKGDRVAILARNRSEYVEAYGVAKAGLIGVPVSWRLSARELGELFADCQPAAVLADAELAPTVDELRGELGHVRRFVVFGEASEGWESYEALLASGDPGEPAATVEPGDVLCLMYTSGTTGAPKGAMLTHGGLVGNARVAAERLLGLTPDDVHLIPMPLFHVGGMWYHLFPSYACGCTTVLQAEFQPRAVLEALERHRATIVQLVPTMVHAVVHEPGIEQFDLSRLRLVYYAASPIPVALLRRAIELFPGSGFLQSYGSTEAGILTALLPEDHERGVADPASEGLLASCGRPLDPDGVRVVDGEGRDLPPGEIGEVVVGGARTMTGYWHERDGSGEPGGWVHTGDLGRFDADGFLYLVDRKHDLIVSGGENVFPGEVEQVLYRDPDVLEAAVFGVPDPRWVEKTVAAVVLRPGHTASAEEIIARTRRELAPYKCPKVVVFTESLPKSATGKILRRELRQRFGDELAEAKP